jgi:hypothetical protein
MPLQWAPTQNNLGLALTSLGDREGGTEHLEQAVDAYRAVMKVFEAGQASYYVEMAKGNLQRAEALLRERGAPGGAAKGQ